MLVPLSWISDYVDISGVSVKRLADLFTMSGTEVKKIEKKTEIPDGVFVAEITEVKPHPNADKLQIAKVCLNTKGQKEVVCGANNIKVGQKVPYALIGTKINNNLLIEKKTIRGVESQGMLCSGKELGVNDEHTGILILDKDLPTGTPLNIFFPPETVFELEVTPNRPDCLSIMGLAREVACFLNKSIKKDVYDIQIPRIKNKEFLNIQIQDTKKCNRYTGMIITNLKNQDSPFWMQNRLRAAGMRPINCVVDITNYVMLETSQPLHAFDLAKVKDNNIIIRSAKNGEVIKTLDAKERQMSEKVLMIANSKKALAIAGLMGGEETEVSRNTNCILLESANFDALAIRKASEELGLRTEGSLRWEKCVDLALSAKAGAMAAELIQEHAGGTVVAYFDKITKSAKKKLTTKNVIKFPGKEIERILGLKPSQKDVCNILTRLGFKVKSSSVNKKGWELQVEIPSWREDIKEKFDLIEEVGRMLGYDQLPAKIPSGLYAIPQLRIQTDWDQLVQQTMVSLGFQEVFNYSIISQNRLRLFDANPDKALKLASPLADFTHVRFSLIPDLIINLQQNIFKNPLLSKLKLFELSRIFLAASLKNLPQEAKSLAGITWGSDFFDIKGELEVVFQQLRLEAVEFQTFNKEELNLWQQEISANFNQDLSVIIKQKNTVIGFLAGIKPKVLDKLDFKKDGKKNQIFVFDLNINLMKKLAKKSLEFQPISKFPPVLFDCAFIVEKNTKAGEVLKELKSLSTPSVKLIPELFDVYMGERIEQSKKSLAFTIQFIPFEATLKDQEVKEWQKKVIQLVKSRFKGQLRDK